MGKWMASYREELLHNKLADLIGGAVKRSCLEPDEQLINLDSFVEDLDPGDSFVAATMDILVKELADRRTRKEEDRRYISERTSRTLRQLSALPRASSHHPRALYEFLEPPLDELGIAADDDDGLGTTSFTALSDAFIRDSSTPSYAQPPPLSLPPLSTGSSQTVPISMPMSSSLAARALPPLRFTSRRLPRVTESSSSLARQSSLRRTGRARTTDFHDFTNRRRSATREGTDENGQDSVTNDVWSSHHDSEDVGGSPSSPNQEGTGSSSRMPSYPFRRHEIGGLFPLDTVDSAAPFRPLTDEHTRTNSNHESSAPREPMLPPFSWFGPGDDIPRMLNDEHTFPRFFSEPDEIRSPTPPPAPSLMPQLRRGGLRAPEVMATEQMHAFLAAERSEW